jgi:hypothetical protein
VRIEYFAISVERRLTHPCVLAISEAARAGLGALEHDAARRRRGERKPRRASARAGFGDAAYQAFC